MCIGIADKEKEGLVMTRRITLVRLQKAHSLLGEYLRLEAGGRDLAAVVAEMLFSVMRILITPETEPCIEAGSRITVLSAMPLADETGMIAGTLQQLGEKNLPL